MDATKFKLPSGIEVELRPYVEAGVILDLPHQGNKEKFLIESIVLKIDGSDQNIYERVRKLRIRDYKALDAACTALIKDDEGK